MEQENQEQEQRSMPRMRLAGISNGTGIVGGQLRLRGNKRQSLTKSKYSVI